VDLGALLTTLDAAATYVRERAAGARARNDDYEALALRPALREALPAALTRVFYSGAPRALPLWIVEPYKTVLDAPAAAAPASRP
jgi:hypothetical protein